MGIKRVFFTADLIESDGSDTSVYGDPCEPGYGQTMTSGWWRPSWSMWEVSDERHDSMAYVYEDEREIDPDAPSPARWLAGTLAEHLNGIERHSLDNYTGTVYSVDPIEHPYEGKAVMPAGHPDGFTDEEIDEAFRILREASPREVF